MKRVFKFLIPLILIPLAIFIFEITNVNSYIYLSLIVTVLTLVLFFMGFERKKTATRKIVIISIMVALSVVGRFIPFFKPVTAITIISAMYLGAESGFTVGALSALMSNIYFGQGPWTPYQMLAWGLIGFVAGLISRPLKKSRVFLLVFGIISGVAFSAVMDIWTVLWYNNGFDIHLYLAAAVTAIPHTLLYSISNFVFLLLLAKPFGEKLQRIKIKYGI